MSVNRPEFVGSPYFDIETWKLKEGAPDYLVKEYEEYMEYKKELEERGIDA